MGNFTNEIFLILVGLVFIFAGSFLVLWPVNAVGVAVATVGGSSMLIRWSHQ